MNFKSVLDLSRPFSSGTNNNQRPKFHPYELQHNAIPRPFYASAVQNNPARLANGVSLSCAKYRAAYLSNFHASQPQPQLPSTTASPTSETRAVEQMCASLRQPREMNHRRME
ncbi:hypothetical protein YC2023_103939 [Brassica napus]